MFMALIDVINAGAHPATSGGAADDSAVGYATYLCADVELINVTNAEQLFGVGVAIEDEMAIALPDSVDPVLDGNNRFDFSDISGISNAVIALFRNSTSEWTSVDLASSPVDSISPEISIVGDYVNGDTLPAIAVGDSWTPPSATATDNVDGSVPVTVDQSGVDLSTAGNYFVAYEAVDSNNNSTLVVLTLPVEAVAPPDTEGPVITIAGGYSDGDTLPPINMGGAVSLPSATAIDEIDDSVAVEVDSSAVNSSVAGNYAVLFTASDLSGNTTTVTLIQPVTNIVVPPPVDEPLRLSHIGNTTISMVSSRDGQVQITIINPDGSVLRDPIIRNVVQGYNPAITLGGVVRSPQRIRVEPVVE